MSDAKSMTWSEAMIFANGETWRAFAALADGDVTSADALLTTARQALEVATQKGAESDER